VVYVNRSYSTGVGAVDRLYPEGAIGRNNFIGGTFDPPPDFAKLAETVGGYGETVSAPDQVGPALRRGLEQTRKGVPAVIACWLPTLVEEMQLPQ
jgi:thiamine pyrophosphate-dependent acetolactate synthase large subunit-like protein